MTEKMFDPKIVADRLKIVMNEHNLSKSEFGRRIDGVSRQSINNWLSLKSSPSASCLFLIGCEFHIDVNWILGLTDERR